MPRAVPEANLLSGMYRPNVEYKGTSDVLFVISEFRPLKGEGVHGIQLTDRGNNTPE